MKKTLLKLWHVGDGIETRLLNNKFLGIGVYWWTMGTLIAIGAALFFV